MRLHHSARLGIAIGALVLAASSDARADAVAGINLGAPVWKGVVAEDSLAGVLGTGAPQVRVNFRIDLWSSPDDTTKIGGRTWFEAYDRVVDALVSQGVEVYGALNNEITKGLALGSPAFEDTYAANAALIVDHFKDRVRVWETINEPNDFGGGASSRFSPAAFARAHARAYEAIKAKHPGDACWDVKLVSGPLYSADGVSAADYLDQTIAAGRAGGTWKTLYDSLGHDPIDDVGYHLYVAQGSGSPIGDVAARSAKNLDAIHGVLASYGLGDRRAWITEIGFRVPAVDEQGQADRLDAAFASLSARADVASVQWFTIVDFNGLGWGLYRNGKIDPSTERPAYSRFLAQAKAHVPALAARVVVDLPKQVTVGEKLVAKVKATNLGAATWSDADRVRLGAAAGCPAASTTNEWTWEVATADGYFKGPADARRYLAPAASVAQGGEATFEVPLTAPSSPGKIRFAARMVKEDVAWFGATGAVDVEVVPQSTSDGHDAASSSSSGSSGVNLAPPPSSATGCSCKEASSDDASNGARGVLFGLGALAFAMRSRRRVPSSRS